MERSILSFKYAIGSFTYIGKKGRPASVPSLLFKLDFLLVVSGCRLMDSSCILWRCELRWSTEAREASALGPGLRFDINGGRCHWC